MLRLVRFHEHVATARHQRYDQHGTRVAAIHRAARGPVWSRDNEDADGALGLGSATRHEYLGL